MGSLLRRYKYLPLLNYPAILIIIQALIVAFDGKDHPGLQDISRSNAGALLFGVPHEGIRYWELVKTVADQLNEELVRNLLTDKDTESSALLDTQQRHFGRILGSNHEFPVVCYWEKYETKLPNEIVSKILEQKTRKVGGTDCSSSRPVKESLGFW